jgi:hypothetical protein
MLRNLVLATGLVILSAPLAQASTLTFDFATTYSNTTLPGGPAPWLTATFNDATASAGNDVRLTLTAGGLTGSEFISNVYFNLNPAINPFDVQSTLISQPVNTVEAIAIGPNFFSAGPDGSYDIRIAFNTAECCRLNDNETVVLDFNLTTGTLSANSFNFPSSPGGTSGPFFAAAHLQGIVGGAGSTWIADSDGGAGDCPGCVPIGTANGGVIPEPTSMLLLGSGLAMAARRFRRSR